MQLIDIGVNLAHDSFDADRAAVLQRAYQAGIAQMIITGSSTASTLKAIELAREQPQRLFATAGVHPHHATELDEAGFGQLERLVESPHVVAVGECGLDYFRDYSPRPAQRQAFERQLELAGRTTKPVFLHQRDAHEDFLAMVREHRPHLHGGVAHCFTGSQAQLQSYLELGLAIGITGWICDERRGTHLLQLMRDIPPGQLLLETDAPYLLPRDLPARPAGRRNEPAFLSHIAAVIAQARDEPPDVLAADTTRAARALFGLPEVK
jgi:TatD DNase family protein